jgi:hypothetical protein
VYFILCCCVFDFIFLVGGDGEKTEAQKVPLPYRITILFTLIMEHSCTLLCWRKRLSVYHFPSCLLNVFICRSNKKKIFSTRRKIHGRDLTHNTPKSMGDREKHVASEKYSVVLYRQINIYRLWMICWCCSKSALKGETASFSTDSIRKY